MATSTAPRPKTPEPEIDEPLSPHADRPTAAEDDRRIYDERVQGKAPLFVPKPTKSDAK